MSDNANQYCSLQIFPPQERLSVAFVLSSCILTMNVLQNIVVPMKNDVSQ